MRQLNSKAKARAADALGIAQAHLRAACALERARQFDAALARAYYAAFFGARAALADKTSRSKKRSFWIGEFNKRFGRGTGWLLRRHRNQAVCVSRHSACGGSEVTG